MHRKRHVLLLVIALAWTAVLEWQQQQQQQHGSSARHITSGTLLLPGAAAQGLTDGGLLGGQSCDAARLEEFDDILLLSDDYSGGRGKPNKGGGPKKSGRKLLQGLLSDDDGSATVTAAAMPVPKTNATCHGSTSSLEAAFHVASAPAAFYPQSPAQLPWVRDQGECASCVGHAVAACAEASLAAFTGAPARQNNFSGGSLYFCGSGGRTCNTAWTIAAAMDAVRQDGSILRTCQDVAAITQGVDVRQVCDAAAARCATSSNPDSSPATAAPVCAVVPAIDSIAKIQLHIRQHGAVVSRLNVNNPELFQQFFVDNPRGIFNDTSACSDWSACGQPFGHAILLVGYNNSASHWIAQSTWGDDFADGGRFRIAYGIAGVGSAPDTYALACQLQDRREQRQRRLPLAPLGNGCYLYAVDTQRTPHLSAVAAALNINITELVRDNLGSEAAPLVQVAEVVSWQQLPAAANSSSEQAAYGCWSQPDCTEQVLVEGCLLSVVHQTYKAGDASASSCSMTRPQPNLSAPLVDGTLLRVCNIPDVTWKGADERLSGSAAAVCPPGQQPDELGGCTECLPGTFKASEGHQDCRTCAAGTFQSRPGATSCQACPAGSTNAEDVPADHDAQSDCGCPPGQVLASLVNSSSATPTDDGCVTCPDDTFKPWTSAGPCLSCPFGSVARGNSPTAHDAESDCTIAFTQLAAGYDHVWGIIAADGSLRRLKGLPVFNPRSPIIPPTLQSVRWLQIVHQEGSSEDVRAMCGLVMTDHALDGSAGVLRCFGNADYISVVPAELNQTLFRQVVSRDSLVCGVKAADGGLVCFSDQVRTLPAMKGLQFVHVAVGGSIVCGIVLGNRSLVCVNTSDAESLLLKNASVAWQTVQVGGGGQVCGLTVAGDLLCPRRGVVDRMYVDLPTNLPDAKYKSVAASGNIMCVVQTGSVGIYCWSSRSGEAQLLRGSENTAWASVTVDVSHADSDTTTICAIAATSFAGRCWNANSWGGGINMQRVIRMPAASSLTQWHQMEMGSLATCGIRTAGRTLVCVGAWDYRDGAAVGIVVPPELTGVPLSAVSLSDTFACVILAESGRVECYDLNSPFPTAPSDLSDAVFDSISTGSLRACGVLSGSRKLVCWGNGFTAADVPPVLASAAVESVVCDASGGSCCAVLAASAPGKRIVCWADQAGSYWTLENPNGWTGAVALGNQRICAVQSSNPSAMACWIGGERTRDKATEPPALMGNRDWRSVSLARDHACGVRRSGRAHCWPLGGQQQVKWGQDKLPSDLGESGTVRDVQTGRRHTCILTAGQGNIRCFGSNDMGQMDMPNA